MQPVFAPSEDIYKCKNTFEKFYRTKIRTMRKWNEIIFMCIYMPQCGTYINEKEKYTYK